MKNREAYLKVIVEFEYTRYFLLSKYQKQAIQDKNKRKKKRTKAQLKYARRNNICQNGEALPNMSV